MSEILTTHPECDFISRIKTNVVLFSPSLSDDSLHIRIDSPRAGQQRSREGGHVLDSDIMGVSRGQTRLAPPGGSELVSPTGECPGAG